MIGQTSTSPSVRQRISPGNAAAKCGLQILEIRGRAVGLLLVANESDPRRERPPAQESVSSMRSWRSTHQKVRKVVRSDREDRSPQLTYATTPLRRLRSAAPPRFAPGQKSTRSP